MAEPKVPGPERRARWTIRAAPFVFFTVAAVVGFRQPGLQYDEALFEHGTVQMLLSPGEPVFAHDPGSWISIGGRFWPLMVIPYVGAAEQYLLLPVFAAVGPDPAAARAVGAALAAFGLFLLGRALTSWVPVGAAAAALAIVAIHPDLLLTVLYDDGGFALWTACLGLVAAALSRYVRRRDGASAFLFGLAAGFAVWSRSNFVWLLVSLSVSLLLVFGRRAVLPPGRFGLLVAGGVVGGFPLLLYEVASRFATLRFLGAGDVSPMAKLTERIQFFEESLLLDRNRAVIWGGALPPRPLLATLAVLVVGSALVLVLAPRRGSAEDATGRVASLTVLGYVLFAFSSRLNLVAHHFVAILPLEALVVVLGIRRLLRGRARGIAAVAMAAIYVTSSATVLFEAARDIRVIGGQRSWSDAIEKVADVLQKKYPRRDVYLLDWGFENNLFVLSRGAIAGREIFWSFGRKDRRPADRLVVDPAAVYVTHGLGKAYVSGATEEFRRQVREGDPRFVETKIDQRNGEPYAVIYGGTAPVPPPSRITAVDPARISAGRGFNVQPSGRSAITVRGSGFRFDETLLWNGRPLRTTFGNAGLLTAEVPSRLFDEPGTARITLRRGNREEPGAAAEIPIVARPR